MNNIIAMQSAEQSYGKTTTEHFIVSGKPEWPPSVFSRNYRQNDRFLECPKIFESLPTDFTRAYISVLFKRAAECLPFGSFVFANFASLCAPNLSKSILLIELFTSGGTGCLRPTPPFFQVPFI